jgi:hypothetical protein
VVSLDVVDHGSVVGAHAHRRGPLYVFERATVEPAIRKRDESGFVEACQHGGEVVD